MLNVLYVNFYVRGKANKQSKQPLKAVITYNKQRFEFSTGIYIHKDDWNSKKQEFKKSFLMGFEFKNYLQDLTKKIYQFYYSDNNSSLSLNKFKQGLYSFLNPEKEANQNRPVHEIWEMFLDFKKLRVSWATHQKYTFLFETHFKTFEEWTNRKYEFEDFDINFLDKFVEYMYTVKNHNNNTVDKNIRNLVVFLKWAYERGYSDNSQFLKFNKGDNSIKTYVPDTLSLSFKELQKLLNTPMKTETLEQTRLIFLFMVFTGQRINDYEHMEWSDITEDGFWMLRQKKENHSRIAVPLNDYCLDVLSQFKGLEKPMPITTKFNSNLKQVGKEAGIDDPFTKTTISGSSENRIETTLPKWRFLSAHCSRRTCVSLTSELKIRDEVGMNVTGHKDNEMYRHYNKLNKEVARNEFLQPWNEKIQAMVKSQTQF